MDMIFKLIAGFFCAAGFSVMFNMPRRLIVCAGVSGVAGILPYLLIIQSGGGLIVAAIAGSIAVGLTAEFFAARTKNPSSLFTIPGIIPLVPGYSLYYAMLYLVQNDVELAAQKGAEAVITAISIACGIAISMSLKREFTALKERSALKRQR